jgi:SNF2 family DNA or RNA helicase
LHEWLGITEDKFFIIRAGKDAHVLKLQRFPYQFLIISYDFVSKFKEDLEALAFRLVVLDESHYIKSSKA